MALCHNAPPASLGGFLQSSQFRAAANKNHCLSVVKKKALPPTTRARGLGLGLGLINNNNNNNLLCGHHRNVRHHRSSSVFVSYSAAHDDSKASDIDIDKTKEDLKAEAQESQQAWQQALDSFKEQALKMQSVSKEAYELYSEKATIILKQTSEKLKIQADKARHDLSLTAKEIAEESKEYLAAAAQNSPEHVKDIVDTFSSPKDDFNDVSKLRDFYIGVPYGALLSFGGFLSFMLTGSIPAIRFGMILGGTLLALSISSLRSWKKGESSPSVLKGQAAIATILFLRDLRLWSMPFIFNVVSTIISGGVAAFYLYRIVTDGGSSRASNLEVEPEN